MHEVEALPMRELCRYQALYIHEYNEAEKQRKKEEAKNNNVEKFI